MKKIKLELTDDELNDICYALVWYEDAVHHTDRRKVNRLLINLRKQKVDQKY